MHPKLLLAGEDTSQGEQPWSVSSPTTALKTGATIWDEPKAILNLQHYCKYTTFAVVKMETKINWDVMGVATSVACAIHCALLPVLVSTLPVFGINIIHNAVFEWGMIAVAFIVGSYSLFHGYIKHHHSLTPILIFTVGFLFLFVKQFFHSIENWFLIFAVPLIISAHYYNYRLGHKNNCSSPQHQH